MAYSAPRVPSSSPSPDGGAASAGQPAEVLLGRRVMFAAPPEQLASYGLPKEDGERGDYIVELNLQHPGAVGAAEVQFRALYDAVLHDPTRTPVEVVHVPKVLPELGFGRAGLSISGSF